MQSFKRVHAMKHMKKETLDAFAQDLNQLRDQTKDKLGSQDARYIRKMIAIQRISEIAGRILSRP